MHVNVCEYVFECVCECVCGHVCVCVCVRERESKREGEVVYVCVFVDSSKRYTAPALRIGSSSIRSNAGHHAPLFHRLRGGEGAGQKAARKK